MAGEKTEAPTPRKRDQVRKQGRVSKSMDLNGAVVLLAGLAFFRFMGSYLWGELGEGMRGSFRQIASPALTEQAVMDGGMETMLFTAGLLAPMLGALLLAGVLINLLQTGFLLSFHPLQPKLDNINPVSGARRILSIQALVNLGKSLLKVGIVTAVIAFTIRTRTDDLMALALMSVPDALGTTFDIAFDVAWKASLALFVLALGDYAFQRWQFTKNLRMSKDEVRDEMKQTEGSPETKARIRRQRTAMLQRTMQATAQADVLVTNPTHYAVALKYDPLTMAAPRVLAKGERLVAQRMKEVAREHGIPLVENKPLARALHKQVGVGKEVPPALYQAVAEVLAFVYRMRGMAGAAA